VVVVKRMRKKEAKFEVRSSSEAPVAFGSRIRLRLHRGDRAPASSVAAGGIGALVWESGEGANESLNVYLSCIYGVPSRKSS
jgi:hypothetical protein